MARYRLDIVYDGTPFSGWQRQDGVPSVQQAIEEAIEAFAGPTQDGLVRLHAAGRTDAGVHAEGQVAHVDLTRDWEAGVVRRATNANLLRARQPVAIRAASRVDGAFHARFSATARHYRYLILDRDWPPTTGRHTVWWVPTAEPLDVARMGEAAGRLMGRHDFTTFRAAHCQADSPVRTLDRLDAVREGEGIVVRASARSFLHHQVRSMVGALKRVGEGRWSPDDVAAALDARERARCPGMAPAAGLCLTRVDYAAGPGTAGTGGASEGPSEGAASTTAGRA